MPGEPIPSSLETRMRASPSSIRPSAMRRDDLLPTHIGLQRRRDRHRAVVPLKVLQDRDQGPADREAGAVEGVHRQRCPSLPPGDSAPSSAAPGTRRNSSSWKSRDRFPVPAARPRCRRSSARRTPYRRSTAARRDRRGRGVSALPRRRRSCARARRRNASGRVIETSSTLSN